MEAEAAADAAPPLVAAAIPRDGRTFKAGLLKRFGTLERAWEELDRFEDGRFHFRAFVAACRRADLHVNVTRVFEDLAGGEEFLTPAGLDPGLPARLAKLREQREKQVGSPTRSPGRGAPAQGGPCFQQGAAQTWGEVAALRGWQRSERPFIPPHDAKAFKAGLVKKFGTLEHAWEPLDVNEDGVLQFHEFVAACRRIQFGGNLKKIFEDLTGGKPTLTPEALDPDLPAQLAKLAQLTEKDRRRLRSSSPTRRPAPAGPGFSAGLKGEAQTLGEVQLLLSASATHKPVGPPADAKAFKASLVKQFFRLEWAWKELDLQEEGGLSFNGFVAACRRIHFAGNLRKVFDDLTRGGGKLTPELLDEGLPAALAALAAKQRAAGAGAGRVAQGAPRTAAGGPAFASGLGDKMQTMGEVHSLLCMGPSKPATIPPSDAKAFKAGLLKKFAKLDKAWEELDTNEDGKLQFHEFVAACRRIQFGGNLRKIYSDLTGGKDALSPDMLDARLPDRLEEARRSRSPTPQPEPPPAEPHREPKVSAATERLRRRRAKLAAHSPASRPVGRVARRDFSPARTRPLLLKPWREPRRREGSPMALSAAWQPSGDWGGVPESPGAGAAPAGAARAGRPDDRAPGPGGAEALRPRSPTPAGAGLGGASPRPGGRPSDGGGGGSEPRLPAGWASQRSAAGGGSPQPSPPAWPVQRTPSGVPLPLPLA